MACRASHLVLVVVSVAVLLGAADAAAAAGNSSSSSVPGYCAVGQAIPQNPLGGCTWYVAIRSCDDMPMSMLPLFQTICCAQLQGVPAECRCRALRLMMEAPLLVGADPAAKQRCRAAQDRFAPAVVSAAECAVPTVHGTPFCNALDDE